MLVKPVRHTLSLLAILLAVLVASQGPKRAEARVFNVRSYGAVGDGKHDDQPAIAAAIADATAAGAGNTVYIPGGNYLLDPTENYDNQFNVKLANQLSITGDSTTVLLNPVPTRGFFWIWASNKTTLNHVTLKRTRRLFSQMTVKSISTADNSVTVTVKAGYDDLDTRWIANANQLLVFSDPASGSWGDHSAACSYYAPGDPFVCWPPVVVWRKRISGNTWKLGLNTAPLADYVGATAVLWNQTEKSPAISATVDGDITISNLNYYAAGSDGLFWAMYNSGNFLVSNVTMALGSGDLVSGYTGSWSMNNHWAMDIEKSSFTKVWDDAFNTGALYNTVYRAEAPNVVDVDRTNAVYTTGDTVAVWDWTANSQSERSRAKVTTVDCGSSAPANTCRLTLDRAVTVLRAGTPPQSGVDAIDRIIDIDAAGTLHINNSSFQSFHTAGVAVKAQNVTIENSRFFDTIGPAINAGPNFFSSEGPTISGLTVRNNTFSNISSSNIAVGVDGDNGTFSSRFMNNSGVVVSNNSFLDYGRFGLGASGDSRYPVWLRYVTSGSVSGSTLSPYDQQDRGYGSTQKVFSPNVTVAGDRSGS